MSGPNQAFQTPQFLLHVVRLRWPSFPTRLYTNSSACTNFVVCSGIDWISSLPSTKLLHMDLPHRLIWHILGPSGAVRRVVVCFAELNPWRHQHGSMQSPSRRRSNRRFRGGHDFVHCQFLRSSSRLSSSASQSGDPTSGCQKGDIESNKSKFLHTHSVTHQQGALSGFLKAMSCAPQAHHRCGSSTFSFTMFSLDGCVLVASRSGGAFCACPLCLSVRIDLQPQIVATLRLQFGAEILLPAFLVFFSLYGAL